MFHNFGFAISSLLETAEKEREILKHPYVGSEHLLLAILKSNSEATQKLNKMGLTYHQFKKELIEVVGSASKFQELVLYTPLLKRILELAMVDAEENNSGIVTENHLLLAMLEEGEGIAIRIMMSMDLDLDELYDDLKIKKGQKKERNNLEIYKIGVVLNDIINMEESVIGRERELELMIETLLRKKKNNPLLIGRAGVGKTSLVEELVRRIKLGMVPEELQEKEIVMLEMGALVAGTKYRGEFEERLTKLIKEIINNKNIILFIDEIHSMVNAGGAEGAINASDILKPYLARGELKCIGATTTEEYYKFIERDKALERRFEKVLIEEPSLERTKEILTKVKKEYENHHHVKITNDNINDIVYYAEEYIFGKNNPDKSLELLDSVCANKKANSKNTHSQNNSKELIKITKNREKKIQEGDFKTALELKKEEDNIKNKTNNKKADLLITTEDILKVVEMKTGIPVTNNNLERINQLEKELQKRILGQDDAIKKIIQTLKGKRNDSKLPLSIFLSGPSGVGKTETVKIISEVFGKKESLLRLDMSEYTLDTSIHKLIGTPGGYVGHKDPYIFQKLKENPYRIILVDELEKANPKVWNLFLQIMDEGFITDSCGEKIRFDKTMIFMTSNLEVKEKVGFTKTRNNNLEENLSKEFLGRFEAIVSYQKMTEKVVKDYIKSQVKNPKIDISKIIQESEYEKYGLRNIKHILRRMEVELQIN